MDQSLELSLLTEVSQALLSFNPYFSGSVTGTIHYFCNGFWKNVSILILVDQSLELKLFGLTTISAIVSILILVDQSLEPYYPK